MIREVMSEVMLELEARYARYGKVGPDRREMGRIGKYTTSWLVVNEVGNGQSR